MAAAVIAVCSWIAIPSVPPVSLQTFAVLACAGIFGGTVGVFACFVWIALGLLGLPVFAGFMGGVGVILGPSGGYIAGFVLASVIVGAVSGRTDRALPLIVSMVTSIFAVYVLGTAWYAFVYLGGDIAAGEAVAVGVLPFLPWDALKITLAFFVVRRVKNLEKIIKNR